MMTIRPLADWAGDRIPAAQRKRYQFMRAKASGWGREPMPWSDTLAILDRELTALDASNIVLQISVTERDIRLDGQLRADARPADPAVRLLFDSKHGPLTYQCDRFATWQDNGRAIALGLEALRKVERYGITEHGQQYKGWLQLEAGSSVADTRRAAQQMLAREAWPNEQREAQDSWSIRLGEPDFAEQSANTYRRALSKTHPDRHGGMRTRWDAVEAAGKLLGLAR